MFVLQADLIDMPFSNCLFKIEVKDTDKNDLFQIILIILSFSRLVADDPRSIGHTSFPEIDMVYPLHLNDKVLSIISNTMQVDQNDTVRRIFRLRIPDKTEFDNFLFTL